MVIPPDLKVGTPLEIALPLKEVCMHVELSPHIWDCFADSANADVAAQAESTPEILEVLAAGWKSFAERAFMDEQVHV